MKNVAGSNDIFSKNKAFPMPVVLASRCLGFDRCRYNGIAIQSTFISRLRAFVEFVTVCPEADIGLGVPREPIRVIRQKTALKLFQPATARDLTEKMAAFCTQFLGGLPAIDGVILKARSPSCGLKNVKIYPGATKANAVARGTGFFARAVLEKFPSLPVEDEDRLLDNRTRERFLTRLFMNARWRTVAAGCRMKDLVQFHSENKYLYMSYHEPGLRALGRIAANRDKKPVVDVYLQYGENLSRTMGRVPRPSANVNVLLHALGFFSDNLTVREKRFFLAALGRYRRGKVPLNVCLGIVNSWIARFGEKYLAQQTYFAPYPGELSGIRNSGKVRGIS